MGGRHRGTSHLWAIVAITIAIIWFLMLMPLCVSKSG